MQEEIKIIFMNEENLQRRRKFSLVIEKYFHRWYNAYRKKLGRVKSYVQKG